MLINSRIDDKKIQIDLNQGQRYGVMLSGGLDSSLMLFLMLKDLQDKKIQVDIQPYTIPKHDGSIFFVPDILKYFRSIFKIDIPDLIKVGDPEVHHRIQSEVAIKEIFKRDPTAIIYSGINQNPQDKFDYSIYPEMGYPNRIKKSPNPRLIFPFIELQKHHILDLVILFQQEKLLTLTHSCTEQTLGRCMNCFQCRERQWAFDQLGIEDSGLN
jgi:hypothetical protein